MDTSFDELKSITDSIYAGNEPSRNEFHNSVVNLLANHGIRLRQKDGSSPIVTISHPISLPGSMVVGIRYTKLDGSKTEDHFLFQPNQEIERCYGKKLERLLPEYRGTHKLQR
jgi:hypothetical protein